MKKEKEYEKKYLWRLFLSSYLLLLDIFLHILTYLVPIPAAIEIFLHIFSSPSLVLRNRFILLYIVIFIVILLYIVISFPAAVTCKFPRCGMNKV